MNDYQLVTGDLTVTKNAEHCILWSYPDPASPLGKALQARGLWRGVVYNHAPIPHDMLVQFSGKPWTGGWGHTGDDVQPNATYTQDQADAWLLSDMQKSVDNVRRVCTVELTRDEFIALCDLDFNIGNGNFNTSTLLKDLNAKQWDAVIAQFKAWNKAGGEVLQGLVDRRQAEATLFQLGVNYSDV